MASFLDRLKATLSVGNANSWSNPSAKSKPQPQRRPLPPPQPRVNAQQLAQALKKQPQAQNFDPSFFRQLTHNPVTNIVGDVAKGAVKSADRGLNMISNTPLNVMSPKPQDVVEHTANNIQNELIKKGLREDKARFIADQARVSGYNQILQQSGIGLNDSKFTIGRKAVGDIGGTASMVLPVGQALKSAKVIGRVAKGAGFGSVASGVANLSQDDLTPTSELQAIAGGAVLGGVLPIGVEGAKLAGKGINAVKSGKAMTTPDVRINIKDQQVLQDYTDYRNGVYKAKPSDLNVLLRDARAVGNKHGVDLVNGTPQQQIERASGLLDQLGAKNRAIQEGGFARIPLQGSPKGKPVKGVGSKGVSSPKIANGEQPLIPEQIQPTSQAGLQAKGTQLVPDQAGGSASSQAFGQNEKLGLAQQVSKSHLLDRTSEKNRGFINSVLDDPNTAPEIKNSISSLYKSRNTKDLQIKAANLVKDRPDIAEQLAFNAKDDTSVAVASELIKSLQKSGNYDSAISLTEKLAADLTEAGRTVQAASIYSKLTPEGVLRFAQREITKYNQATGSKIKLNPSQAEKLTKLAQDIEKLPEGYKKQVATAKLVAEIQHSMPSTVAERLSTLQTMAQLLNPKTNIRNIGGNTLFGGLDNISQTIATPVDKLLSLVTGQRTTALPSLKTQAKSGAKGLKIGISEAKQGINTGPTTQYELNSVPVFRGKILGALEKTMNGTLRGADRAYYTAAFDDTIKGLMKVNKTKTVTPQMIEQAHHNGLYRTFQDSNAISDFFVGTKRSLNRIGIGTEGKRFGLGDLVLKYPKTPANLLARGIDYSPAGFLKAVFSATKPLVGKPFNQKEFVDNFSRAVVGSGSAFGIGYVLAENGIITAQPEKNKDLRNLQKTQGLGGYQINVSALKRWVTSGFNNDAAKLREGDTLTSYDWAQPIAIPISAGAALGTNKPTKAGAESVNSLVESANTLAEQPLLQGVQRLFNSNTSLPENVVSTLQSAPASFSPTIVNQVNQLFDNTPRNMAPSQGGVPGFIEGSVNQVRAKVPGLAQTLPKQYDVLGSEKERYQNGTNNPFNVFLNPAFVNKYKPNKTAETTMGLYDRTGETKQLPNTIKPTITINGKRTTLNGQQQSDYQKYVGEANNAFTQVLSSDERFNRLSDAQKVNLLSSLQTDVNTAAKVELFGDQPKAVSTSVQNIVDKNGQQAIEDKLKAAEKANKPKAIKIRKAKVTKAKKGKKGRKGGKGRKATAIKFRLPSTPKVKQAPKARVGKSKQKAFIKVSSGSKPKKITIKA